MVLEDATAQLISDSAANANEHSKKPFKILCTFDADAINLIYSFFLGEISQILITQLQYEILFQNF
ncbi:MAG: hypothetical protein QXZ44_01070 [Ferroplasma sp.]